MIDSAYQKDIETVITNVETDPEKGLTQKEAEKRLEEHGENRIETEEQVSPFEILLSNIHNVIVYLLLLASAVSFFMGETIEAIAILVAVLIAVVSGFFSEYKAQQSVAALQEMVITEAKVIRDGKTKQISSVKIVPGDLLFLEEGDAITADARLIKTQSFAAIESALTGESESVDKDQTFMGEEETALGDRLNMVYMGTAATRGNAHAVVTATGHDTEIGQISEMMANVEDRKSPLDEQLDRMGKTLVFVSAIITAIIVVIGILSGEAVATMIKLGIILAIASVPESLPAVSTMTLSIGMRTMADHNALVKTLPAVETLGSTTYICTDKTGTLTENQMTVKNFFLSNGGSFEVSGTGYEPEGKITRDGEDVNIEKDDELRSFIEAGVLASNASLSEEEKGFEIVGDPTDGSVVVLGKKAGIVREELESRIGDRVVEKTFNSDDKYMASLYEQEGTHHLYLKGATDVLMELAGLSEKERQQVEEDLTTYTSQGLRTIGVGRVPDYRGEQSEEGIRSSIEGQVTFLGVLGILDPPREDVKQAIKEAQHAGIRVLMITGDHPRTASAIAEMIGIDNYDHVITGAELSSLSEEELDQTIADTSIFARVSPRDKMTILKALNDDRHVTAMTGDGVNDAPALKEADIGIAMGIRGTEVAKEASDMILVDDKFSTIVNAVREGRVIFDNIEKFVKFLFTCNFIEILVIFFSILLNLPMPITALQILWLNLVVDVLPAMSLAWENAEEAVMDRTPRQPDSSIMNKSFLMEIGSSGLVLSLGSLAVFFLLINGGTEEVLARSTAFTTMAFGQFFYLIFVRKKASSGFDKSFFQNRFMMMAIVISVALQLVALYVPFLQGILGTTGIGFDHWALVLAGGAAPVMIIELVKRLRRE